jgi:hypothetical protein
MEALQEENSRVSEWSEKKAQEKESKSLSPLKTSYVPTYTLLILYLLDVM